LKSVIADAYEYVNTYDGPKFDIVIMDINYEEANLMLTPPKKFLEPDFLKKLTDLMTPEGFATFNTLTYDNETKQEIFGLIAQTPKTHKFFIDGEEDVNRVIHLVKSEAPAEDLRLIQMEKVCKEWGLNKGLWLTEMRIKQKIDKIQEIKLQ
jgi:spermidine synthase